MSSLDSIDANFTFSVIGISEQQYISTWGDYRKHPYAQFLGRILHKEVIRHLLSADYQIFLRPDTLPNRAGFPTKFVETVTSGTLPITNLNSNLSDYLKDGHNGVVINSLSEKNIRAALRKALTQNREEIALMKSHLDTETFEYSRFVSTLNNLLNRI